MYVPIIPRRRDYDYYSYDDMDKGKSPVEKDNRGWYARNFESWKDYAFALFLLALLAGVLFVIVDSILHPIHYDAPIDRITQCHNNSGKVIYDGYEQYYSGKTIHYRYLYHCDLNGQILDKWEGANPNPE